MGPASGVILVNLIAVCSSLLIIPNVWRDIDWHRLYPIALAAIPGVLLGAWLTVALDTAWLELLIGVSLVVGLIATIVVPKRQAPRELPVRRFFLGSAAGMVSTTAGSGGPVILMYASMAGWPFRTLAATIQPYFTSTALFAMISKTIANPANFPRLHALEWLSVLAAVIVGVMVANRLARRIPVRVAKIGAYAIAILGASITMIRAVNGLL